MKKLLLILLCLPMIGLGQTWQKTYDLMGVVPSDAYVDLDQTFDGGYRNSIRNYFS